MKTLLEDLQGPSGIRVSGGLFIYATCLLLFFDSVFRLNYHRGDNGFIFLKQLLTISPTLLFLLLIL